MRRCWWKEQNHMDNSRSIYASSIHQDTYSIPGSIPKISLRSISTELCGEFNETDSSEGSRSPEDAVKNRLES